MRTIRISFTINGIVFSYLLMLWVLFVHMGLLYYFATCFTLCKELDTTYDTISDDISMCLAIFSLCMFVR